MKALIIHFTFLFSKRKTLDNKQGIYIQFKTFRISSIITHRLRIFITKTAKNIANKNNNKTN